MGDRGEMRRGDRLTVVRAVDGEVARDGTLPSGVFPTRNLAREVSELERNVDRLAWALRSLVRATDGMDGRARQVAIDLLEDLKGGR